MEQSIELIIGQSGAHALQSVLVDGQKSFSNACEANFSILRLIVFSRTYLSQESSQTAWQLGTKEVFAFLLRIS